MVATIASSMDTTAQDEPFERWAEDVRADPHGVIVVEGDHVRDVALQAAGRLPISSLVQSGGTRNVRLVVAESLALAAACERRGIPVVWLTGDGARDVEHVSWMIDAPHAVPTATLDQRARLGEQRAQEVAAYIAARSRGRLRKVIRKVRPGADRSGLPPNVPLRPADLALDRPPGRPRLSLPSSPTVSVIVATRDHPHLLRRVLAGLEATAWPDLQVVIVDNGSSDADALAILSETRYTVENMPIGFNFPRLMNRGATVSTGDILVFLNNDIEIPDPLWLSPLVEAVSRPDVGPVGCLLTYPDGSIQHCGMAIGPHGPAHPFSGATRSESPGDALASGQRTGVTAACMAVRADVFWQLGGFDPLLKRDYNDIDLCLRAADAGYRVWYTSATELVHNESSSRGKSVHPDTVGDWLIMRTRWADILAQPDRWLPGDLG